MNFEFTMSTKFHQKNIKYIKFLFKHLGEALSLSNKLILLLNKTNEILLIETNKQEKPLYL